MINKISIYESGVYDPYHNLATEECLLKRPEKGELIFFLWQNDNTVVIGRNQNCLRECDVTALENDGGSLARRMSGGGAVYHDMGNVNFSFITAKEDYDETAQTHIVVSAVRGLGIHAESGGRNDISVNGRKFSGNAYHHGVNSLRHGTILVNTDLSKIGKYLGVSGGKLETKGVQSVRANVANLTEFDPGLDVQRVKTALKNAVADIYKTPVVMMDDPAADKNYFDEQYAKHLSECWRIGGAPESGYTLRERFAWGEIEICMDLKNGVVDKCSVFSDALDTELACALPKILTGLPFQRGAFTAAVLSALDHGAQRGDIAGMFAGIPA